MTDRQRLDAVNALLNPSKTIHYKAKSGKKATRAELYDRFMKQTFKK